MSIDTDDFSDKLHDYKNKSHKRKYENIKLRRELVEIMFSRFYKKREIAELLSVDQQTVTRDIQWLKSAAKKKMTEKMQKKYPGEYHRYSAVIDEFLRLTWDFAFIEKLITGRLHINL